MYVQGMVKVGRLGHTHGSASQLRPYVKYPNMRYLYCHMCRVGRRSLTFCIKSTRLIGQGIFCRTAYQLGYEQTAEHALSTALPSTLLSSS